jgi:hypothetical protein
MGFPEYKRLISRLRFTNAHPLAGFQKGNWNETALGA